MTDTLANQFGLDPHSADVRLAVLQVAEDRAFLEDLIQARRRRFADLSDFSEVVGVEVEELEDFESDPLDFDLAFIRLYASGVGAFMVHVTKEPESLELRRMLEIRAADMVTDAPTILWSDAASLSPSATRKQVVAAP